MQSRPEIRLGVALPRAQEAAQMRRAADGEPFRILVLADTSGRSSRGLCEPGDLASRRIVRIDRDNFDEAFAAAAPTLLLRAGASGTVDLQVSFRDLDDFHPDALFRRVELFGRLRGLRDRLRDPATASAAIAELTGPAAAKPATPPAPAAAPPIDGGSLLDAAIGAADAQPPRGGPRSDLVDRLVREFVTPFAVPRPDARVPELVADVERAISGQMRALMHAPAFQQLEAAWRSLHQLVHRLDDDADLPIHVLDVSKDELRAALASEQDPLRTRFAVLLTDRPAAGAGGGFALIVADQMIDPVEADVQYLAAVAAICAEAGSVFLCGAQPAWVGSRGFGETPEPDDWNAPVDAGAAAAWASFRQQPAAASIGLVMPRFLLRLPYGARSSPAAGFAFEEESTPPRHDDLLWANGAFGAARLLATTWLQQGWRMQQLARDRIGDLPVHVRHGAHGDEAVPCAEIELTSRGAQRIGAMGIMPLASVRGADAIELGALRSAAQGDSPLAGRWG